MTIIKEKNKAKTMKEERVRLEKWMESVNEIRENPKNVANLEQNVILAGFLVLTK